MTLAVATLVAPDAAALLAAAARAEADVVEVRLDLIDAVDVATVERLAKGLHRPALATVRLPADGGRFRGSDAERRRLLSAAVASGFAYVDVEADASFADELLAEAQRRGARVVLSRHDLVGTPTVAETVAFAEDAARRGAWCAKLASTLATPADAARLVEAALLARAAGLRFAFMAVNDATLRALAPALGSALVYGSAGAAAAPGQLPVADLRRLHALLPTALGAGTRLVALLGDPVAHSRSPAMQNAAFRARSLDLAYVAVQTPPERLSAAVGMLRLPRFLGANVTVPHKEAAAALADRLAPSAEAAAAANVLVNEDGRLVAHNTDGEGALRALGEAGVALRGRRALVLGAGGAARAVARALAVAGCDVTVANRDSARAAALAAAVAGAAVPWGRRAEAVGAHDLLVNCTSLGLAAGDAPVPPVALREGLVVFDAAYRAGGTDLVRAARERGLLTVPGEAMLLHQGAAAFELWTREAPPMETMRRALAAALEVPA